MTNPDIVALIKHRLIQADTALEDARFLLAGGRSTQSVVNRCYYAMFYAALALLQHIGKAPSKHTGVISIFDTEFVSKGMFSREFSKDLHKAFEARQVSDYKLIDPLTVDDAKALLEKAAEFIQAVKNHLGSFNLPF